MRNVPFINLQRTRLILCCFMLTIIIFTVTPLVAGNSVFSYNGTPIRNYGNDIYGMTMGDVGIADVYRQNTGYGNPAMLGSTTHTLFSTGLMMGWTQYTSQAVAKENFRDNSLDFPFFSMAFPLQNHRLGFQFNSVASGEMNNQTSFVIDSTTVVEKQAINRYIYRADVMYAYNFGWLNVGAGLNYYLGHETRWFNQNGGFGFFNTTEQLSKTYKNPSFEAGFTAALHNISVGVVYNAGATLKGDITRTSIHEVEDLGEASLQISDHIGAGITTKFLNEYKVSADLHYDLWANTNSTVNTRNSLKLGIGFADEPKADSRKTFVGKMPKRIGFSYRTLPFEVNGNTVTETAITGGLTLPVKETNNSLDFGLQYFMRGNTDKNTMQDRGLMIMFGITGFDILTRDANRSAPRDIPKTEEIAE